MAYFMILVGINMFNLYITCYYTGIAPVVRVKKKIKKKFAYGHSKKMSKKVVHRILTTKKN